jgi:hypothetical protein
MFCTQCRTELPEGCQFCSKCGIAQSAHSNSVAFKTGRAAGRRSFTAIVIVGLGIILLLVIARSLVHTNQTNNAFVKRMASIGAQPHEQNIADQAITVKADGYAYYKFVVPSTATNAWVDGHFSASGGFGNDIEVYLLDEDGFANWQNDHQVTPYYNSGRLTEGQIHASLPVAGWYYLVFNNNFSLITPKAVQVVATLHYTN